jgi:hypothetical protein
VSWAIIADIDIESEKWRCCGPARFTVGALVRALCLRKYRGRLWYLPAGNTLHASAGASHVFSGASKEDGVSGVVETKASGWQESKTPEAKIPMSIPPLDQPVDASWRVCP